MVMTKLRIDLTAGTLEVEGDEAFVSRIYEEFKETLSAIKVPALRSPAPTRVGNGIPGEPRRKRVSRKANPSIVKDLDLSAKDDKLSLKDFFKTKAPSSAMENNTVFTYYLTRILGVRKVSMDHIYTCYKAVGLRMPALEQSLFNASSKKGWLDTSSMEDIRLTTLGENLIEHDLPRKQKG